MSLGGFDQEMQTTSFDREEGLANYFGKLTQAPLLTADEEVNLAMAVRQGDEAARRKLVESNMRLVINIARNYRSRSIPLEDLIQEGAIGLMQAIERFDPERGYRFSTYASHWIRQSIGRALDNKSKAIRLPAHISQALRRVERERMRLARELGREPSHEDLADALGISATRLSELRQSAKDLLSLDTRVGDHDSTTLVNLLPDDSSVNPEFTVLEEERWKELQVILMELTERERRVMTQRLRAEEGDDLSQARDQLAKEMQISRERIRQIELQAIKKLRAFAQRRKLVEYLSQ